jgi:hypothetical protein
LCATDLAIRLALRCLLTISTVKMHTLVGEPTRQPEADAHEHDRNKNSQVRKARRQKSLEVGKRANLGAADDEWPSVSLVRRVTERVFVVAIGD